MTERLIETRQLFPFTTEHYRRVSSRAAFSPPSRRGSGREPAAWTLNIRKKIPMIQNPSQLPKRTPVPSEDELLAAIDRAADSYRALLLLLARLAAALLEKDEPLPRFCRHLAAVCVPCGEQLRCVEALLKRFRHSVVFDRPAC
jgi:hypothetical protein